MSGTIIIGSGGHAAIHKLTVAQLKGNVSDEQKDRYIDLLAELEALAQEVPD